jgi:hypothetical protein
MPCLTPYQHRKVLRLLESRTLDAATNIFRCTLGLDPEQVDAEAMHEMREEIAKVFYPLIGRLISGEAVEGPSAPSPVPSPSVSPQIQDLLDAIKTVPEEMMPERIRVMAKNVEEGAQPCSTR